MGIQPIICAGGLDLVRSKQEAAPGSLTDCYNFEVGNKRGYQKIKGIRAYSGGVGNDVFDPYVLWTSLSGSGQNIGIFSGNAPTEGFIVQWGSGGNYNAKTQTLTTVDGYASVCFSRKASSSAITVAMHNINGRLPSGGDIVTVIGGSLIAEIIGPPVLASTLVASDYTGAIFGGTYSPNDVDHVSNLIHDFDMPVNAQLASAGWAYTLPCSPLGSTKGGFFFEDALHVICDLETWAFADGNAEPLPGDSFFLYYAGVAFSGSARRYTVEKVILDSGSWAAGDAAGKIILEMAISTVEKSSVILPLDCGNDTTSTASPMTMGALVRSQVACLYREAGQNLSTGESGQAYVRQDLGYEVSFSAGEKYFTVLNRSNREAALETAVTDTGWVTYGTAAGWTNSNNAIDGVAGTYATQNNTSLVTRALTCAAAPLAIPDDAVILGIEVEVGRRKLASGFVSARDREGILTGVPGLSQNKKKAEFWPTATAAVTYGSSTDLWGTTLTSSIVNDPAFGVSISAENINGTGGNTRDIDSVRVRVTYKERSPTIYFGDQSAKSVTSITRSTSTATVTTSASHGYNTGDTITVAGAVQPEYNGSFVITVTGLTTFTYTVTGSPATPATGTITTFRNFGSATVVWYYKEKGDWSTGDAQGTLTLYNLTDADSVRTGQYMRSAPGSSAPVLAVTASGADKVYLPASNVLETNTAQWEITPPVNFFGAVGTEQVFAVSGADFAGSWDGQYWIRIRTGNEPNQDMPRHVAKFGDQLVLGYEQGICIASDLGYPESYAGVVGGTLGGSSPISDDTVTYLFAGGAQQVLLGDSVYGLIPLSQQSLGVMCRNSIQQLVGSGGALVANLINGSCGIIEYTLGDIGIPVFCDYRGIGTVTATAAFGDFARGRLSDSVAPWLVPRLQQLGSSLLAKTGPIKSYVVRSKNQYRLPFKDKYVLTMTMVGNDFSRPEFTIQQLPFVPAMTCTGATSGGKDLFFLAPHGMGEYGATSNILKSIYEGIPAIVSSPNLYAPSFVYQGEVGTTWDDLVGIDAYIVVNGGAANREWETKHYDQIIVGGQCFGFGPFGVSYGTDFGDINTNILANINGGSLANAGIKAFSEQPFSVVEKVSLDGYALSMKFISNGDATYGSTSIQTSPYDFGPVTIQSVIVMTSTAKERRK